MSSTTRHISLAIVYFFLSTVLTWWFVAVSPLYISEEQKYLSTAVAGGKWGIQIMLAIALLGEKRWVFIKEIGFVCLVGSCVLIPYATLSSFGLISNAPFFVGSLAAAIVAMIYLYHRATKRSEVALRWWYFWLVCLATAVSLQLTVVFQVIKIES